MKTLKLLFMIGSLTFLLTACEDEQYLLSEDNVTEHNLQAKTSKQVEVPFKAKQHTAQAEDALSVICSANSPTDFWGLEHQVGTGNATHIGNYSIDLEFCFHVVLNDQGLPDFGSGFGEFMGSNAIIIANDGDQLFTVSSGGNLSPIQNEHYIFEFYNTINITGGTGRFENAAGEIINYGLVRSDGTGTDHTQEGAIILNK